jgi:hypothetical protein
MRERTELPIISNKLALARGLTRREMLHRLLAGLGAALAGPVAATAHPMYKHLADPVTLDAAGAKVAGEGWSPEFLDSHQNETLIAVAEAIVPGSGNAQVNRIIDLLLTVETAENQKKFTTALEALAGDCKKRFAQPMARLTAPQMNELLSACSTAKPGHPPKDDSVLSGNGNEKSPANGPTTLRDHFDDLKGWIVATYYSSEVGMRELGWTDEFYFDSPLECSHPDGHN